RCGESACRAYGLIHRFTLPIGMVAHRDVIWVVVEMNVHYRQAPLVLLVAHRDPVRFLWHILADDPHPGHIRVAIERGCEFAAPCARIEEGGHEGNAEGERLQ